MYTIIENPRMMNREEINSTFDRNWVYIVNANIDEHGWLIEGMPVVLGDYQFEGVEDGIYEQYNSEEYGRDLSYTLSLGGDFIPSVFGIGW